MVKKYPAVILLPVIVCGIIIADICRWHPAVYFGIMVPAFLAGWYFYTRQKNPSVIYSLFALSLLCGIALRYGVSYYQPGPSHIHWYADSKTDYTLYLKVSDWPILKPNRTEIICEVDSLEYNRKRHYLNGSIMVNLSDTTTAIQRGDRLILPGRIYPVNSSQFGKEFNYQRYLNYKGISGVVYLTHLLDIQIDRSPPSNIYRLIDNLRMWIRSVFYYTLPDKAAALAVGFLIGETRNISPELYRQFKDSGTLHLLAVSGSNVALVLLFVTIILLPFPVSRKVRSIILLVSVFVFTLLAYGEPSVIRAAVMAGLVIIAGLLERKYNLNNIVASAAILILVIEPSQLFMIGFQLSFVIAWGLVYTVPKISGYLKKHHTTYWYRFLFFPFIVSLVAQVYATGLIGLYFQKVPLLSPVANLFVVPLVSVVVVGSLFLLVAYLILPVFGLFVGSLLSVIFSLILNLVEIFGNDSLPAITTTSWSIPAVASWYFVLSVATATITSRSARKALIISILLVSTLFLSVAAINSLNKPEQYQLTSFAVPGGVTTIIRSEQLPQADLILTGLKNRDYPVDSVIIQPKLKQKNVSDLRYLFVLSSEFNAWFDLLRLSKQYHVDSVFVPVKQYTAVLDAATLGHYDSIKKKIYPLHVSPKKESGYYYFHNSIYLNYQHRLIQFTDRLRNSNFEPPGEGIRQTVIIGESWYVNSDDCVRLFQNGTIRIICSKFYQQPGVSTLTPPYSEQRELVDLSQVDIYHSDI